MINQIMLLIPDSSDILDLKIGHLNLDTLKDVVLILKSKNESQPHDLWDGNWNRPLLIFFQQANKTYKLKIQNDSLILCEGCGGMVDPYGGMELKDNKIVLSFYGGMRQKWTRELEFTYDIQTDNFILTKDEEGLYDSLDLESNIPPKSHSDKKKIKITIDKFLIR